MKFFVEQALQVLYRGSSGGGMSARHAQLLRTLVEHTVHQLPALSASAMALNPRKRTWQLVFWAVASRRGDDRSSTASKRGVAKKKISLLPTPNSRVLTGFRNFCGMKLYFYLTWSRHIYLNISTYVARLS